MDQIRTAHEESVVAGYILTGSVGAQLLPMSLDSELELRAWLADEGTVELRTNAGALVYELPSSAVTVGSVAATLSSFSFDAGTGPLDACGTGWTGAAAHHVHRCRHTEGHAAVSVVDHECTCGTRLPI